MVGAYRGPTGRCRGGRGATGRCHRVPWGGPGGVWGYSGPPPRAFVPAPVTTATARAGGRRWAGSRAPAPPPPPVHQAARSPPCWEGLAPPTAGKTGGRLAAAAGGPRPRPRPRRAGLGERRSRTGESGGRSRSRSRSGSGSGAEREREVPAGPGGTGRAGLFPHGRELACRGLYRGGWENRDRCAYRDGRGCRDRQGEGVARHPRHGAPGGVPPGRKVVCGLRPRTASRLSRQGDGVATARGARLGGVWRRGRPARAGPAPSWAPCRDRLRSGRCAGRGGAGAPGRPGRGGRAGRRRGRAGVPPGPAHCSAGAPGRPRPGSEHPLCWAAPGFVCGATPGLAGPPPAPAPGPSRSPRELVPGAPPQLHRGGPSPRGRPPAPCPGGPAPHRGCALPGTPHRGRAAAALSLPGDPPVAPVSARGHPPPRSPGPPLTPSGGWRNPWVQGLPQ